MGQRRLEADPVPLARAAEWPPIQAFEKLRRAPRPLIRHERVLLRIGGRLRSLGSARGIAVVTLEFPPRYEPLSPLGKGGGGEVWAVRDRHTGERHALKVLSAGATEGGMAALVRDAVTLSGLEWLG